MNTDLIKITFDPVFPIGSVSSGPSLSVGPLSGGTFTSEPNFEPQIDAVFVNGVDHVYVDPSFKHVRINVQAVLKNKDESFISYTYKGIIEMNPEGAEFFAGSPNAKTTDYGSSFSHVNFETGAGHLKALETSLFVGSARFLIEPGKPPTVETKISRVVHKS